MNKQTKQVSYLWRTAAIILGVLLLSMVAIMVYGFKISSLEAKCVNYCYEKQYESFSYDTKSGLCSCYTGTKLSEIIPIK
jgi:hypothetical protein